jgi:hypothetical protein
LAGSKALKPNTTASRHTYLMGLFLLDWFS